MLRFHPSRAIGVVAIALLGVLSSARPVLLAASGTGEISGSVAAAATGGPIRGASVSLSSDDEHERVTETDDQGRFQFRQLPAGRYHLTATQPGFLDVTYGQTRPGSGGPGAAIRLADGQRIERLVLTMPRGGAISGVVFDSYGDPAFGASVTTLRYVWGPEGRTLTDGDTVQTDERGMYRIAILPPGEYVVKAAPADSSSGEGVTFAPTYHGGGVSLSGATVVTLGLSEERSGINVPLQRLPAHRVAGTIVDAAGRPPTRPLMIALRDADAGVAPGNTGTQVLDGKFTFPGLAPGRYLITVLVGSGVQASTAVLAGMIDEVPDDGPALWAQAEVTVLDRDITDVRLVLQPGSSVSGRVVVDGGALSDLSKARVRVSPVGVMAMGRAVPGAPIDARGNFTILGIPPGRYRFSIDGAGAGLTLRSAIVGDRDALDFPFEVAPNANVAGAVLTLTDRATELSGTLSDATGQPTSDYMVVVFAADTRYWDAPSRRIVAMRPSSDGRYTFRDLPAGEYRLAALTDAEPNQWFDPRFLGDLVNASLAVRLAEGEPRTLDVRIRQIAGAVDSGVMGDTNPDKPLVVVFHSGDPELLPIAESALEQEGIEYLIRPANGGVPVGFGHTAEFGGAEGVADILVNAADADRASAALADLALTPEAPFEAAPLAPDPAAATAPVAPSGPREYRLTEVDSGAIVGDLTQGQLAVLLDQLEEESSTDRDYYIDAATIDMIASAGADAELLEMLKRALGSREGVEVAWARL